MTVDPTLTISIDRSGMVGSPGPLVFSGRLDGTALGIVEFDEVADLSIVTYATSLEGQHGDPDPLSWRLGQSILGWRFTTPLAATEQASRDLVAEVRAAIQQSLSFPVTNTASDSAGETWTCNPGAVTQAVGRTLATMRYPRPVWAVSLPCYPVRSVA